MAVRAEKRFVSLLATQSLLLAPHALILHYQPHLMQTALAKWANSFGNQWQTVLAKWHYKKIVKGNIKWEGQRICSDRAARMHSSNSVKTHIPRKRQKGQVSNA